MFSECESLLLHQSVIAVRPASDESGLVYILSSVCRGVVGYERSEAAADGNKVVKNMGQAS